MSRRRKAQIREILPDPVHNSIVLSKFTNAIMLDGKKAVAESLIHKSFLDIQSKTGESPLSIFIKAIDNVKPLVEVRSRRVGGATYQIPMEVRPARRSALAMRWIATYAKSRSEKNMTLRLANELLEACEGRGEAVKKKEDTHRMAEANRAFSHFRF